MVAKRTCRHRRDDGSPCQAVPLKDEAACFWHSPAHADEAAEARRLGGQRRRRERIVSGVYDFEGLGTITQVRRLVEVAVLDTLGLENSVGRNRALGAFAQTAAKLLEVGEFEERLEALEQVVTLRDAAEKRRRR
jgi:hypothetical protein